MPVIPEVLSLLIAKKVSEKMKSISGTDPLKQSNPSYFIEMCKSIGSGIATGTPFISFTSVDSGLSGMPPAPAPGTGVGIIVDSTHMSEQIYTSTRDKVIEKFEKTTTSSWPPNKKNPGEFLKALTDGVAEAIKEHFITAFTLTSVHNMIYSGSGEIKAGSFFGLSADLVKMSIIQSAPNLKGEGWPMIAESIANGYVNSIQQKATATVSIVGVCVPPAQVCGIPLSNVSGPTAGTGVAA